MRRPGQALGVWAGLSGLGVAVIVLPDRGPRVLSLSDGHGPSAVDLLGVLLLLAGWLWFLRELWLHRRSVRHAGVCAAVALGGLALVAWSVTGDHGSWWALGAGATVAAQVVAALSTTRPRRPDGRVQALSPSGQVTTPPRVRRIIAFYAVVFAYGTLVHAVRLLTGSEPDPDLPGWLATFFVSLVVLDPLCAVLLAVGRRAGHTIGCVVLVADALANGYANYALDGSTGMTTGRVGHLVITVLALVLVASGPRVRPWLR